MAGQTLEKSFPDIYSPHYLCRSMTGPIQASSFGDDKVISLLIDQITDYAIFVLTPTGEVASWNRGAQRIKGYTAPEIIGKHFSCFYVPEDVASGKPQLLLEAAAREGRAEQEGWRVRKDGSTFWASVVVTALRDTSGELLGFGKVTRDVTERMQAQQALRREMVEKTKAQRKLFESEESLRQLSLHLLRTQDEERRRIGREVHDSLGQYLTVLKMRLDGLASEEPNPRTRISVELTQCSTWLAECLKEVRTISYLLYPPMLEEKGLKSAIPWYLDGFTQRSGIEVNFEIPDDLQRLSRGVELALFRVLQEALTNIHRHSGSAKANIRLSRANGVLILEITDYGKGVPPGILEEAGPDWMGSVGVGLRGMNERLRQLGGTFDVLSTETGTTVRATVPIHDSH